MINIKPEVTSFYKDFLQGWMIGGLKTISNKNLGENFVPGLICFVVTEAIGRYLPLLKPNTGSTDNQKYFYRSLFRLQSQKHLKSCDKKIRRETGDGLYQIRNGFVHKYIPNIGKKIGTRVIGPWNKPPQSLPIIDVIENNSGEIIEIVVNVEKYVKELEYLLNDVYDKTFNKKIDGYRIALNRGYNKLFENEKSKKWWGTCFRVAGLRCRFQIRYI